MAGVTEGSASAQRPQSWDAEATDFDEAPDHGLRDPTVRTAWATLLTDALPPPPGRIADFGCGTGSLSLLATDLGFRVDGIDFSEPMVAAARSKAAGRSGVGFTVGDASDPPLKDGIYDAVICRHVLWALPDPGAALRRWVRLLRPAGRVVLIEGRWWTGAGLAAERTLALLREAGYAVTLQPLDRPDYWGGPIDDERYLAIGSPTSRPPASDAQ